MPFPLFGSGFGPSFPLVGVGLLSRGEGWHFVLGLALRVGVGPSFLGSGLALRVVVGQAPTQKERMGKARPSQKGEAKAGPHL